MIDRLIDDIHKALDNKAYLAALSLALTLPDICGKAAFPSEGCTKRYIKWYDEYVGYSEKPPYNEDRLQLPYLSGEVVFQLRCSMLHQGTPNIDPCHIKNDICKINRFELIIEPQNNFGIYSDCSCLTRTNNINRQQVDVERIYKVNIRRLCFILCSCAEGYFKKNKNQFDFFNCTVVDYDAKSNNV